MIEVVAVGTAVSAVLLGLSRQVWRWLVVLAAVPSLLMALVPGLSGRPPTWEWAPALLGLGAALGLGRAWPARPLRIASAGFLVVPAFFWVTDDGRLALFWWPVAGAFGLTALLRGRRGRAVDAPQLDDVDRAAIADFDTRYQTPRLGPVVVVIAAYDEEAGLPPVLGTLPDTVHDLHVDVVVVDDGSTDRTAAVAEEGAYVVRCEANRGQGRALRLGYRIARENGAAYVVTTDADGQYDVADIPAVLEPILAGRADFVTGSRRLGHQPVQDRLRRVGVHVFAWTVSLLTGRWLTDTSFGLRAMRVEVTAAVTLNQPQYQSSELLIGAISHGFRVLEVPGTMHRRGAGSTKKGGNWVYGRRYAGVVVGTWWREGCPRPVTRPW